MINENNKVLRELATWWDFKVDGSPMELVKDMTRVMFTNGGVGLAAPQIAVSKRVFIMGNPQLLVACVNPILISGSGKVKELEGCLSFPDLWLHVDRYETITVSYKDVDGKEIKTELNGIMSRVFQHELDHLNGVCFDRKVSPLSLKLAKERQAKAAKKRARAGA